MGNFTAPPHPPSGSFLGGLPSSHPSVKASAREITPRAGRCPGDRAHPQHRLSAAARGAAPAVGGLTSGCCIRHSHRGVTLWAFRVWRAAWDDLPQGVGGGAAFGVLHVGLCVRCWDVPLGPSQFASRVLHFTNSRGTGGSWTAGAVSSVPSWGDLYALTESLGSGCSRAPPAHEKTISRHGLLRERPEPSLRPAQDAPSTEQLDAATAPAEPGEDENHSHPKNNTGRQQEAGSSPAQRGTARPARALTVTAPEEPRGTLQNA